MKLTFGSIFAFVLIIFFPTAASSQEAKPSLSDLNWLAGCWEFTVPEKQLTITEQWMRPAGGMTIGSGRTLKGGKAVAFEFLRLVEEADGIYYVAKPNSNKEETRFKLIKSGQSEVVFENPTHDFPQRIIYRRSGEKLDARIEGAANGKTRGLDFPYARVRCEQQ
jgi:hypothetical protein